ncbi:hypothetical protein MMPV_007635 [Pyropia vietnamensis]
MGRGRSVAIPLAVAAAVVAAVGLAARVMATSADGPAAPAASAAAPKRYIVMLHSSASPAEAVSSLVRRVEARARAGSFVAGVPALKVINEFRTLGGLVFEGSPADAEAVRAMEGVQDVEEDGIVTAA